MNNKMFYLSFVASFIWLFTISCNSVKLPKSNRSVMSHQIWDGLVKQHVSENGLVNYKGFVKDSNILNEYLDLLSQAPPNPKTWSKSEQIAYWINAYNAFTVKLIVQHYPVESIKDIKKGIVYVNTVWDMKFFQIGGQKFDLNNIEHGILRTHFDEPRIHFAVNCASISCPALLNEAFTGADLDNQLNEQTKLFFSDPDKNRPNQNPPKISPILNWFKKDFTKNGSLEEFINQYLKQPISTDSKIEWMDYDWGLNDSSN